MDNLSLLPLPDLDPVRRARARLIARAEDTDRQFERLTVSVGQSKARVEDEPEVMAVLEALQAREHQRAVGDYEQLLTLLLQDVLPGERQVVLDLRTERGLPALDVFLRKGEGQPLEDALHGTGGSVTNLLSAGLRFIALARSGLRPFLILDEADCWIKPALAARFAGVVQQMAEELGVQVLMISHHDDSLFEPVLPHRLRLEVSGRGLTAHWAPTASVPTWDDDQAGMRSIELMDFQSHQHTVLPLSPGVTLLQGDNDIGKSAVAKALRSVFYAESNDTFIRHGAAKSRVVLDFGPENLLSWERHRKGKVKVSYALNDRLDGSLKHHTEGARDVPAWVADFGIAMADELDIQLGDQHDPVFLLNKRPSERAKALAVGDDAGHVQAMLALDKQELNEARASVRQGEKSLETLYRLRAALEPLKVGAEAWESIERLATDTRAARERGRILRELGGRWLSSHQGARAREALKDIQWPELPVLVSHPNATTVLRRWKAAQTTRAALEAVADSMELAMPAAPNTGALLALRERWQLAQARVGVLTKGLAGSMPDAVDPNPNLARAWTLLAQWRATSRRVEQLAVIAGAQEIAAPELPTRGEAGLLVRWGVQRDQVARLENLVVADAQASEQIQIQLDTEFSQCPTCQQPLDGEYQHAAKRAG